MATLKTGNLSATVIKRVLGEGYKDFLQQYNEARITQWGISEPSANDKAISRWLRKEKSLAKTAAQFGISAEKVLSAVARTSAWEE